MDTTNTQSRGVYAAGIVSFIGILAVNAIGFLDHDTESGLGCGANWPLCHGSVIPAFSNEAVVIEYVHRLLTLGFVVAFAVFLIGALRSRSSRRQPRLGWSLAALLAIETFICTAGVLWPVPNSIMALLAPVGLAAQGTLLIMLAPQARGRRLLMPNIIIGVLALYLYVGSYASYAGHSPWTTAIGLALSALMALYAVWTIVSELHNGRGPAWALWPIAAAPLIPGFSPHGIVWDLLVFAWLSYVTAQAALSVGQNPALAAEPGIKGKAGSPSVGAR
jgi:heme A synthase